MLALLFGEDALALSRRRGLQRGEIGPVGAHGSSAIVPRSALARVDAGRRER